MLELEDDEDCLVGVLGVLGIFGRERERAERLGGRKRDEVVIFVASLHKILCSIMY